MPDFIAIVAVVPEPTAATGFDEFQVKLTVDNQHFNVGPLWDELEEADGFANMLLGALRRAGAVAARGN